MFSFFSKAKDGDELKKSSRISLAISQIFSHKKLDSEIIDELEESLILADIELKLRQELLAILRQKNSIKILLTKKSEIF